MNNPLYNTSNCTNRPSTSEIKVKDTHFVLGKEVVFPRKAKLRTYFKSVDFLRDVHSCQVDELSVLSVLMVSQEREDRDDTLRVDQHLQLITKRREKMVKYRLHTAALGC